MLVVGCWGCCVDGGVVVWLACAPRHPGHTPLAALAPLSSHERGGVRADGGGGCLKWGPSPSALLTEGWGKGWLVWRDCPLGNWEVEAITVQGT